MRAVVLSDTHIRRGSKRRLPDAAYRALDEADVVLHAGDVVAAPVLDELSGFAPVHAVLGNNDDAELAAALPETLVVALDGVRIGMVHDSGPSSGRRNRMRKAFPDSRVVVFGHSHIPINEDLDGLLLFNPGSPTWKRRAPFPSMGILWIENGDVEGEIFPV